MSDRGIKKWAPYKSLVEQTDSLRDLDNSYKVDERPVLSSDQEEEINEILVHYHGQEVEVKYYKDKKIWQFCGVILKIDQVNRWLVFEEKKVLLADLVGLKSL